jgi:aminoglycoside 2'-N-acetyltransferase I
VPASGAGGRLDIASFPEAAVPADLAAQVAALQAAAFGPPAHGSAAGPVHDPALFPVSMLLVEGTAVVAALDVLSKLLTHAGEAYLVTGLSTVVTDPARRRQGHGATLVNAAREAMKLGGADLGLFTCDSGLAPFYLGCGWSVLDGAVLAGGTPEDPLRSDSFDKVTLGCFFSDRAAERRTDFEHCDIALYPGAVDRLW